MRRASALYATAALLCLVFITQSLALPSPAGNIMSASHVFPRTVLYSIEQFPVAAAPAATPAAAPAATNTPSYAPSGPTTLLCRPDPRFHGVLQAFMYGIGITLMVLTTALSGLTAGVMGVDDMRLQIWVHTGNQQQKEYAGKLLKVRSHPNWLLASLIITSVGISEALPIVLSHIFRPGYWLPFVLSTLLVAFFGQLVPYTIMPMYILRIAGKMTWFLELLKWLTAPVSVPTAYLLRCGKEWRFKHGHRKLESVLPMDELEAFIKLHEVGEGFGGVVKGEVGAVARGIIRNQNEPIDLHVDQPWDSVSTLELSDKISDDMVDTAMNWHLDAILITETATGNRERAAPPKVIGILAVMDLLNASCIPDTTQRVGDLPIYPILAIRAGYSKFSALAAFAQNDTKFAVVIPKKDESVSTPASIKWTSGMNLPSTSRSDPEDRMGISTVSDTALIQTPVGILSYEVLLKDLFSSPMNELDHTWCRDSGETERRSGNSRRKGRSTEKHEVENESPDSHSTPDGVSDSHSSPAVVPDGLSTPGDVPNSLPTFEDVPDSLSTPADVPDSLSTPADVPDSLSTPGDVPDSLSTPDDVPNSLPTPGAVPNSAVNPPGKGHNLRAPKRFGIAALAIGKYLPSFRGKRNGNVEDTYGADPFDGASRMENAHRSLDREQEGPATLTVPKKAKSKKYLGIRRRTPTRVG